MIDLSNIPYPEDGWGDMWYCGNTDHVFCFSKDIEYILRWEEGYWSFFEASGYPRLITRRARDLQTQLNELPPLKQLV